ncbi:hypothetical protein BXY66_1083 [Shimia isoporae]|uniref:Uncharacterized protein n=1 Tax=Shimia isoporae TaxID=647720 RepID=A0A4R1NMR6_9RHOB|nr:hypothetical protein [Shimia isoporae]TCL09041.1 hypothetical protein BXY66_1083 [Shimia isoporae]
MVHAETEQLIRKGDRLVGLIAAANGAERYSLHQDLHRVITNIRLHGATVPLRFRDLDLELLEEEIEDRFDNLPV